MMSTTYVFPYFFSESFFLSCFFNFLHSTFMLFSSFVSFFLSLRLITLCLLLHPCRSQCADSGSMYMMNWAGTPAAQVPPRVHGDTMRGELLYSVVIYDTSLLHMHMWNSLSVNSLTAAFNMISQCWTLQDNYWHAWRWVLEDTVQIAPHCLSQL